MNLFYYKAILRKCLFAVTRPDGSKSNLIKKIWLFQRNTFFFNSNFRHCFFIFNVFLTNQWKNTNLPTYHPANYEWGDSKQICLRDGLMEKINDY